MIEHLSIEYSVVDGCAIRAGFFSLLKKKKLFVFSVMAGLIVEILFMLSSVYSTIRNGLKMS